MVTLWSRFGLTVALVALSGIGSALAVTLPLVDKLKSLSPAARDVLKRTTPAAPHFVVYSDTWQSKFPTPATLRGFTVYALSFLLNSGAADMALAWQDLGARTQSSLLAEYNAAGISVVVSLFGSTDAPTSSRYDPVATANTMANWVLANHVNGVDVDYEDLNAFRASTGAAETWLINFTKQMRTHLPQGKYILTHAPLAPWFSPNKWSGGGYLAVDRSVGALIDWAIQYPSKLNVCPWRNYPLTQIHWRMQFYNQGVTEYTTCNGLLKASSGTWPETAVFQIATNGVKLDKLVIGKPATTADANNGYMNSATLASCVSQAAASGWDAGVMVWQYPHATSEWITAVRGSVFPIGGTGPVKPPPPPTTTHIAPSPTSTKSGGSCSGVSAWSSRATYVRGNQVTYNGGLWTANQWNEDEYPGGPSKAWNYDHAC